MNSSMNLSTSPSSPCPKTMLRILALRWAIAAAAKDRLGLRIMGVHDERDTWRRYARRATERWTAVAGFKPF
ncbi:MAG: hypothetical protein HY736_06930, partial [Verrucomicrobia bacterium]|nr:hypothetical protein [Verrucomicrobiota bacterium]